MKRFRKSMALALIAVLTFIVFSGCAAKKTEFSYSDNLTANGYWKNVNAKKYVKLCEYKGISVSSDIYAVSDATVQGEIDTILAEYSTKNKITDRAVADGDTVNIDYIGSIDGVPFEGGSTDGAGAEVTIGVTEYIDDFLQQLIGHTPGEKFDITVTFPEDYGKENLNGKDAVFAITLNNIVETVKPELTDAFIAEKLSATRGWNTVAEMRDETRSGLQKTATKDYLKEFIMENSTVSSVPKNVMKHQEDLMIQYYEKNAAQYSMELDEFLTSYMGVANTEELLKKYKDDNTKSAKLYLITQAIAEDSKITVLDSDMTSFFTTFTGKADYSTYEESYGLPYLKFLVLNQKVIDYLTEGAVLL